MKVEAEHFPLGDEAKGKLICHGKDVVGEARVMTSQEQMAAMSTR